MGLGHRRPALDQGSKQERADEGGDPGDRDLTQ